MKKKIAGLAALSTLLVMPAQAEIGRGPGPGKAYISVEGGYKNSDGAAVSSHGDLRTNDGANADSASAVGAFAGPELARLRRVTESPAADQINSDVSAGGPVSITGPGGVPALSTTDNANAAGLVRADELGVLEAFVDAFSTSSAARASANAVGGASISAEDGAYGALTFGYGFRQPLYGMFDRIEVYGGFSRATEDSFVNGAAGAISVDGTSAFAAAVIIPDGFTPTGQDFGPITTDVEASVSFAEFGARLKADRWKYNAALLTAGLEGFYIAHSQNTEMNASIGGSVGQFIGSSFFRNAEVDSDLFGGLLSLEGQVPISGTALSLIGRAFGGIYHMSADGEFRDNFGADRNISDDISQWGYRVGLEAGIRYDISSRTSFSVTGSVDHFSDIATADLPNSIGDAGPERASLGTDDLTNYKVGARLTVTLDDDPAPFK